MSTPTERLPLPTRAGQAAMRQAGQEVDAQADGLLARVQETSLEQAALVDTVPLESQYAATLAVQVQAKHDQVERIEDKLENLIEQQASRMAQVQARQPGMLALPGTRAKWQQQMQAQQATKQRLEGRLEVVREIKEGMGLHCPRIEELATRKLRAKAPELASDWDDMREAQRLHQVLLRKQEHDKQRLQEAEQGHPTARGLRLGLSQAR